jgi:Conjugative transposon protein TcpC
MVPPFPTLGTRIGVVNCPLPTIGSKKAVIDVREDSGNALLRRMAARRRRDNLVFGVLATLAVIGGGATILGWILPEKSTPAADSTATMVGHAQLAGAFAQDFVTTYLTTAEGQKDRLGKFIDSSTSLRLSRSPLDVSDPAVVYVRRTVATERLEVWAVTVSVRLNGSAQDARSGTRSRQYYGVAVSLADGGLRALAAPALVGAPSTGPDLATAYAGPCTPETPLATAVSGFLSAYLAGSGDISRYTTANTGIAALEPAPFTELESVAVVSDDTGCGAQRSTVRVLATVTPRDRAGASATLAYPLTMARADGQQWQVQSMDVVPALSDPVSVTTSGPADVVSPGTSTPPTTTVTIPPAQHN